MHHQLVPPAGKVLEIGNTAGCRLPGRFRDQFFSIGKYIPRNIRQFELLRFADWYPVQILKFTRPLQIANHFIRMHHEKPGIEPDWPENWRYRPRNIFQTVQRGRKASFKKPLWRKDA